MSSSSSTSSDTLALREAGFIGDVIHTTLAYLQENEGESSRPKPRNPPLRRDHEVGHNQLVNNYISDDAVYAEKFRSRFRMHKVLFLHIVHDIQNRFPYFEQRVDERGKKGFSTIQKCIAAIRQLAFGMGPDSWDEYLRMSERTTRDCLYKFAKAVIILYRSRYLRKPTINDIHQLYTTHENKHGFPGMLGSIDCMHWRWSMCHNAWRGQFMRGDQKQPTIILEAVASYDLWIWHAFFGQSGANNDINVLDQSPIFNDIYLGKSYDVPFVANRISYKRGYYLTDGIYPELAVFVKSFTCPNDDKRLKFKAAQESARKGIERVFGVLKRRWQILSVPARFMEHGRISSLMYAYIILHNMVLDDEGKAICRYNENENLPNVEGVGIGSEAYMANRGEVYNQVGHHDLHADLVKYIFNARTNPVVDDYVEDDLFDDTDDGSEMFDGDWDKDFDDVPSNDD